MSNNNQDLPSNSFLSRIKKWFIILKVLIYLKKREYMKKLSTEEINKYFLDSEGMTYKELYTLYNCGTPFEEKPPYLNISAVVCQTLWPMLSLEEFLREKNMWERYLEKTKEAAKRGSIPSSAISRGNIEEFERRTSARSWICDAFMWDDIIWQELNTEWELLVSKNKGNIYFYNYSDEKISFDQSNNEVPTEVRPGVL